MFGVPPMNPRNPQDLPLDTSIRVKFITGTFSGPVSGTQTNTATIHFDLVQKSLILRKHHDSEKTFPTLQHTLTPSQLIHPLSAGLINTTLHFYEILAPEVLKPLVSYSTSSNHGLGIKPSNLSLIPSCSIHFCGWLVHPPHSKS